MCVTSNKRSEYKYETWAVTISGNDMIKIVLCRITFIRYRFINFLDYNLEDLLDNIVLVNSTV